MATSKKRFQLLPSRILPAPRRESTGLWTALSAPIQSISLVLGGCWVIFQYVTFQHQANDYALKQQALTQRQQELANIAASVNLQTLKAGNELELQTKELAIGQAKLGEEQTRLVNRGAEIGLATLKGAEQSLASRKGVDGKEAPDRG